MLIFFGYLKASRPPRYLNMHINYYYYSTYFFICQVFSKIFFVFCMLNYISFAFDFFAVVFSTVINNGFLVQNTVCYFLYRRNHSSVSYIKIILTVYFRICIHSQSFVLSSALILQLLTPKRLADILSALSALTSIHANSVANKNHGVFF